MNHQSHAKRWINSGALLTGFLLVSSLLVSSPRHALAQVEDTLSPNATIHVEVADEPDDSGDRTIDSAGNIDLLYVNSIHVGGLTIEQARVAITTALKEYIKYPQVVVTLVSKGGILIEVDGAVTTQGQRVVRPDSHLYDVLSPAEPTPDAQLESIQIVHGLPNQPHSTDTVNYLSYVQNKDVTGNPLLQDGDVITVFEKQVAISITMRGSIVKPGALSVANTTTVLDAIQAAGGLAPDANRKAIFVQHVNDVSGTPFNYDDADQSPGDVSINPVLRDGDTIVVDALATAPMITISGGVLRPAPYPLLPRETLCDAISYAGGQEEGAHLDKTTIVRKDPVTGKSILIPVDAKDISVQASTYLQTGDNIIIPGGHPKPASPGALQSVGILGGLFDIFRGF